MPRCVVEATSINGSGRSNEFDVTGSGGGISSVSGRVTSRAVSANPIIVTISTSPPRQQTLFINSRYAFENVPTGTYTLQATQGSDRSETRTVTVVAGHPAVQDLVVRSGRRPVLFVPGIMGSLAGGSPYGYPYLTAERPFPSDLRIAKGGYGVVNVVGWNTIAGALYEYEVFESPWDWRVPALGPSSNNREIQPAWQLYLTNQIDDAKRISGVQHR